ncbi:potassium channel family protein [Sphingomonas flavalba]|uniref:potassium channel family protein n=1 Tax=Sphingomonas flavalba TaxID=2559804 RepID=UPI00109DDBA6|nr:potassium channel family protein [Sphingomonas flavalba]
MNSRLRRYVTLRRRPDTPVWVSIGWRVLFVLALVGIAVGVHWIDSDGLQDAADGHVSFLDVVYFTMISITTTGYGDIVPVSDRARLFDALIVTPIRVFVVLLFIGTAYSFIFKRTWDRWRMALIQKSLSGHIIIAGFGTSGSEAVEELLARGIPASDIVVLDPSPGAVARAEAMGCNVLEGDATRDRTLEAVRLQSARALIISAGRDDTSILIALTARHVAPEVQISLVVRAEDNELPARAAGANVVINPVSFAGLLLAGSAEGPHIADYLADLASTDGKAQLAERLVDATECGKPLSAIGSGLGVRVYRGNAVYGPREPEVQALLPGDIIVEIVDGNGRPRTVGKSRG